MGKPSWEQLADQLGPQQGAYEQVEVTDVTGETRVVDPLILPGEMANRRAALVPLVRPGAEPATSEESSSGNGGRVSSG